MPSKRATAVYVCVKTISPLFYAP